MVGRRLGIGLMVGWYLGSKKVCWLVPMYTMQVGWLVVGRYLENVIVYNNPQLVSLYSRKKY